MASKIRGTAPVVHGTKPSNPEVAILQDDISKAFRNLQKDVPFLRGALHEVEFKAGSLTKAFSHGLDGACRGFIILDIDAPETIYRQPVTNSKHEKTHIELVASGACNVQVWIWR